MQLTMFHNDPPRMYCAQGMCPSSVECERLFPLWNRIYYNSLWHLSSSFPWSAWKQVPGFTVLGLSKKGCVRQSSFARKGKRVQKRSEHSGFE